MIVITTTTILLATQVLQMTNSNASATTSSTIVQAGEATTPLAVFSPPTVEINTGESVTWTNPTKVAEPHTITFFLDNSSMAGIVSPLAVSNTTKFMTIPPGSNNEPILLPSDNITGMRTIIAVNSRTYNPTAIDSQGAVSFMNLNSNYSMKRYPRNMLTRVGFSQKAWNSNILVLAIHLLSHLKDQGHMITYVLYIHG